MVYIQYKKWWGGGLGFLIFIIVFVVSKIRVAIYLLKLTTIVSYLRANNCK